MSVFPDHPRTRYLRAILEGGARRDPQFRLTSDEKKNLAEKILLLVNPPQQPFVRPVEEFIDSDLFRSYPYMSDKQKAVFEHVQDSDTIPWMISQ